MGESSIRLIPTDLTWQPTPEAAAAAVTYVKGLFAGWDDGFDDVTAVFYDWITLIDAGENCLSVRCPSCDGQLSDHLQDLVEAYEDDDRGFEGPELTVPCCGNSIALNDLRYDDEWRMGFARFEVSVDNPCRGKYPFDEGELQEFAAVLGHPVLQIQYHF